MRVMCVVHCTVNVACGVIVILLTGKFDRNLDHLLTSIWDYPCAVTREDWREIGDERLKFHFIFEWFGADEGVHVGHEYCSRPSIDGGLWTWDSC